MSLLDIFAIPRWRAVDGDGLPIPLAKLYCYAGGGYTVLQDVYTTSAGNVAHANPVVADSDGLFAGIYLSPLSYNFRLKSNDDATTYWSEPNVLASDYTSMVDSSFILKNSSDLTKRMQFLLSSITTATLRTLTVPDADGTLVLLALAQTLTNKTLTSPTITSPTITGGTIAGSLGLTFGAGNIALSQGTNIIAANDITIPTDGNVFSVTGATQINRIAPPSVSTSRRMITLVFASNPTVKHNQGSGGGFEHILLNGSVDFVAATNMCITLMYIGDGYVEVPRRS